MRLLCRAVLIAVSLLGTAAAAEVGPGYDIEMSRTDPDARRHHP